MPDRSGDVPANKRLKTATVLWVGPTRILRRSHHAACEASFEAKESDKSRNDLGVAGLLSAVGGASAAIIGPAENISTEKTAPVITLGEEEIWDVSLSTFYIYDKENAGTRDLGVQLARGCGHGGCGHGGCRGCAARGCGGHGCRGCAGRGCGGHGCRGCAGRGCGGRGCGGCGCGGGGSRFCVSVGGFNFCG